jgi:pectate lyase
MNRLFLAATNTSTDCPDKYSMHHIARYIFPGVLLLAVLAATLVIAEGSGKGPKGAAMQPRAVKAFPAAQGFGKYSRGGRGGRVIEVTNLNDSGPGSLRAAVEAAGPRIVVFRTGGTITLRRSLNIVNPYITIAGQSAPGGGIALRNDPSLTKPSIHIWAHDVVVRYIRVRPGPSTQPSDTLRGMGISKDAYNVIVDHCSLSWGVDTNITTYDSAHDITVQWSIISEGLNDSVHPEGPHSKGFGVMGDGSGSYNISVHHNLFAHNEHRNPQVSNNGPVDLVNNVIYDYGTKAISSSDIEDRVEWNVVGNYVKPGPSSNEGQYGLDLKSYTGLGWLVFLSGNISPQRPDLSYPEANFVAPRDRSYIVPSPLATVPIPTTSAIDAYDLVLERAGATRPLRDSVDARVVNNVRNGIGGLIDHPSQVGGWPVLDPGGVRPDSDHDGMPDRWEVRHGLNPANALDGPSLATNGYTNVENYLNWRARRPI